MNEVDDLTREFIIECHENLDKLDQDFLALEKNPTDEALLQNIFRYVHSIKGTSGCLGYGKLEAITHAGENLLSRMRNGEMLLNDEITSALLTMGDAVRQVLQSIEEDGTEGTANFSEVIETLTRLHNDAVMLVQQEALQTLAAPSPDEMPALEMAMEAPPAEELRVPAPESKADTAAELGETPAAAVAGPTLSPPPEPIPDTGEGGVERPTRAGASDSTIRVDVTLLDKLMNLVGELVLTRNQVTQHVPQGEDVNLLNAVQQLDLLTSDLQESVMKTRMQPIGGVWNKLPRIVRDVSRGCGKQVRLEMEGEDTELDKTIIEAIKDPLTHIIRNSIDHGVELPEDRLVAGKPEEGVIRLRARHEGGQVNILIEDDGAGLDAARIKEKALQRGLVAPERLEAMGESELIQLLFLPGFSTAKEVTSISGRGVGMDVVKTYIEKIGGSVDLHSEPGAGTTVRLRIPLTLAIIPALILTCRDNRYALPQVNVLELVRLDAEGDGKGKGIEYLHDVPIYRLRGELLPLVRLDTVLEPNEPHDPKSVEDAATSIVVLQADNRTFGLVVDRIVDTQEIVVKPLSRHFRGIDIYAGATIMGDGGVAMILDAQGIANLAGVLEAAKAVELREAMSNGQAGGDRQSHLIVRGFEGDQLAVPLEGVARLETFAAEAIERVGGRAVVQYRNTIMPLVTLPGTHNLSAADGGENGREAGPRHSVSVVVCSRDNGYFGLPVDAILDIVDDKVTVQEASTRPGVHSIVVLQGRVHERIDLDALHRESPQGDRTTSVLGIELWEAATHS